MKHGLLKSWPAPELVRDVAKLIGFAQFYSRFIPNFKMRAEPLRHICKQEYTKPVAAHWTPEAEGAWEDLNEAIMSDPCIQGFNYRKLCILRTDFSSRSQGFDYVFLQPAKDEASTRAAQDYRNGKGFSFMIKGSMARLRPVCFSARRTRGNKVRLHSHLGKGFSGDYAINKCRQYIFGQCFIWVMDCYAIKFILSYKGGNSAILRLQMQLMCWDVNIIHRSDSELVDADYWSHLEADLNFDPLFRRYLELNHHLCWSSLAPTDLPMRPKNMPYYQEPCIQKPTPATNAANALHIQTLLTDLIVSDGRGHTHLLNVPVRFGNLSSSTTNTSCSALARTLLNNEFACFARETMNFDWVVYSFSNGHFTSTIES